MKTILLSLLLLASTPSLFTEITRISLVQCIGKASPLVEEPVTLEALVVADLQGGHPQLGFDLINGFFLEEEAHDRDDDPRTSEGIYVALTDEQDIAYPVQVGDVVRVTGTVREAHGQTRLEEVQTLVVREHGVPLPAPVVLTFPYEPYEEVHPLERWEGMRVSIPSSITVTEVYHLGRYGQVRLAAGGRLVQPTQVHLPGAEAIMRQKHNDRHAILLDDGSYRQNIFPTLFGRGGNGQTPATMLRAGDQVTNVAGVLDFAFGAYRIHTLARPDFLAANPRPSAPPRVGGRVTVASFNVLNYFNGVGHEEAASTPATGPIGAFPTSRGATTVSDFLRQRAKILSALGKLDANIVGLQEIENDGFGPHSAIENLVTGLHAATGEPTYAFVDPGGPIGTDEIAVGFLYQPEKLELLGSDTLDTIQPGNRVPLLASFRERATGEIFSAVVVHLKSKGRLTGLPLDEDQGDGQGNNNQTRLLAVRQIAQWVATDPTGVDDPDVLILGDFNAYAQEDPIRELLADHRYVDTVAWATSLGRYERPFPGRESRSYSYAFDGQWGTLDYILATKSLALQMTDAGIWGINAEEPRALGYSTEFDDPSLYDTSEFRSSDHNPVLVGLDLEASPRP